MSFDWRKVVGFLPAYGDSTGLGPDFPGSAGDRERGKFRPSAHARLTTVAVSDDEGEPIGRSTNDILVELVFELRLLRHALVLQGIAADIDGATLSVK